MSLSSNAGDGMHSGTEKNPNEKRYLVVSVEEIDTGAAVVCGKDIELDAVEAVRVRYACIYSLC
jgi:hypothetical protein